MPFVFLMLGILFLIVAIRGTQAQFFALIRDEFLGPNNFFRWAAVLLILGALGYIAVIRPVANAFILLVLLVLIVANKGGFFQQFTAAVRGQNAPELIGHPADPASLFGAPAGSGGLSNPASLFGGGPAS